MVIGTPCINLAIIPHKLEAPTKNMKKNLFRTLLTLWLTIGKWRLFNGCSADEDFKYERNTEQIKLQLINIPLSSIILCDRSIVCSIVLALEIKANDSL